MRFSVVVPLYNKVAFIKDTLQSLVEQTQPPHEIIIVDDNSTDGSLNEAKHFFNHIPKTLNTIRVEFIELKENKGVGNARNVGFSKTTGDIISFLDADDTYAPNLLETANTLMYTNSIDFLILGIHLFPSKTIYPDITKLKNQLTKIQPNTYLINKPLKTVTSMHFYMGVGSNVIVKRKWLLKEKFINKNIFYEGIDFWYRIVKEMVNNQSHNKIALLMGNFLKVREVPGSASRKKYNRWDALDVPPLITRFYNSNNIYDKLMMRVVAKRWLSYALKNINSTTQKIAFLYHHRIICLRQIYYYLLHITQTSN